MAEGIILGGEKLEDFTQPGKGKPTHTFFVVDGHERKAGDPFACPHLSITSIIGLIWTCNKCARVRNSREKPCSGCGTELCEVAGVQAHTVLVACLGALCQHWDEGKKGCGLDSLTMGNGAREKLASPSPS